MSWLLYLPAIASPIAVGVAYGLLRFSGKRLREHRPAPATTTNEATPLTAPIFNQGSFGDVIVDNGTVTVGQAEHA